MKEVSVNRVSGKKQASGKVKRISGMGDQRSDKFGLQLIVSEIDKKDQKTVVG